MTSYRIEIKQCPNCDCEFTAWAVNSCNTFGGAKFYTDGSVEGPMFDSGSLLLICPKCSKYFWREDVPTLQSVRDRDYCLDSDKQSFPRAEWVEGRHYEDMVRQSFWRTGDEEKYIRIRAWWSCNSPYRDDSTQEFRLSAEQEENLRRLLRLLDADDPHGSLMKAEIFRELGQFEECLKQLAQPFGERYLLAVNTISKLANEKQRKVGLIE